MKKKSINTVYQYVANNAEFFQQCFSIIYIHTLYTYTASTANFSINIHVIILNSLAFLTGLNGILSPNIVSNKLPFNRKKLLSYQWINKAIITVVCIKKSWNTSCHIMSCLKHIMTCLKEQQYRQTQNTISTSCDMINQNLFPNWNHQEIFKLNYPYFENSENPTYCTINAGNVIKGKK